MEPIERARGQRPNHLQMSIVLDMRNCCLTWTKDMTKKPPLGISCVEITNLREIIKTKATQFVIISSLNIPNKQIFCLLGRVCCDECLFRLTNHIRGIWLTGDVTDGIKALRCQAHICCELFPEREGLCSWVFHQRNSLHKRWKILALLDKESRSCSYSW